jgi:hypothetical protein
MAALLVTIGTDGSKDWVETPDGQKFALGSVSVLSLVSTFSKKCTRCPPGHRRISEEGRGHVVG